MIRNVASSALPTKFGEFSIHVFQDDATGSEHVALTRGDLHARAPILVRVHSACITGEVFHANNCDCRQQLDMAMDLIAAEGRGIVVYLDQEGRGNGLKAKVESLALMQAKGLSPYDAYKELGYATDNRGFAVAADILKALSMTAPIRLLTNNPHKVEDLRREGLVVAERTDLFAPPSNPLMAEHLRAKISKEGHQYPEGTLQ